MKRLITIVLTLSLLSFSTSEAPLSAEERALATTELNNSRNHLLKSLQGLSERQLNYKKDDQTWSVAECVEHIAISEETFTRMLQGILEEPTNSSSRSKAALSDSDVLNMMKDRSRKVKTQERFEPAGMYGSHDATLTSFLLKRKATLDFVKNTEADFRNRYQEFPFGTIDAFQMILFIAAHSERHILQIEALKKDPSFPEN